ncbi:MAG: hypothetical protein KA314_10460 [Chloroflexi bacterium]|nr:hypothetical protein [Chloroflexota bacterium]MBP8056256.1 hypothetical protein [Chloroflexota bacterium]
MSNPRPKFATPKLNIVTPETKFYIDYNWWETTELDLKGFVLSRLQLQNENLTASDMEEVDLVNPQTGEVQRVDGFQFMMQVYFSELTDEFIARSSLVDAVFCILLANANQPMTGLEIAAKVRRDPQIIVKTFGSSQVYHGIRPLFDEE